MDPTLYKNPSLLDFVLNYKDLLTRKKLSDQGTIEERKQNSSDPGVRAAFSSKLDSNTQRFQDKQVIVQQFYEGRIASLERYMAFCVMFHALAQSVCKPWFRYTRPESILTQY